MKRIVFGLILVGLLFVLAAACGRETDAPSPAGNETHTAKRAGTENWNPPPAVQATTKLPKPDSAETAQPAAAPNSPVVEKTVPPAKPVPARCDWMAEFNRVVDAYPASWNVRDEGSWGATLSTTKEVFIAPRTPCDKVRSVMLHEWVHVQQLSVYGGYNEMVSALSSYGGIEVVADCGARQLGATWTGYTTRCTDRNNLAGLAMIRGVRAPNT